MTHSRQEATALAEWRAHWPLPFATMVGFSTIGLQSYGFGAFAGPVEQAFGWTRAEVSALLLGELALVIAVALPIGMALGWVIKVSSVQPI